MTALHLANQPPAADHGVGTRMASPWWHVSPAVQRTVWNRDLHACVFCGFRAGRYQQVVVTGGNARDVDGMVTACLFCHQCLHLPLVSAMDSGVLIWFPEMTQAQLHHVARELYMARISRGSADRAAAILDWLLKRRQAAIDRLGTCSAAELSARLAAAGPRRIDVLSPDLEAGLRLLPADRRILNEQELRYNQFPQILAYWRSAQGPYAQRGAYPWLDAFEQAVGASTAPDREQYIAPAPKDPAPAATHASLAAKLLRDAATFFDNIGRENDALEEQMQSNALVYRQVADLLEVDPVMSLGDINPGAGLDDNRVCTVGVRLLQDAATFFDNVGQQNPPLSEQMKDNARVYHEVAQRLQDEPLGQLDLES